MKAIVHMGTEKTGTRSIQQYLHLNRKELRKAGCHFIQSAGELNNRTIPAYCIGEETFDDCFRLEGITALEEKEQSRQSLIRGFEYKLHSLPENFHTVIISSEHVHSRIKTDAEMDNVYELLSGYSDVDAERTSTGYRARIKCANGLNRKLHVGVSAANAC